jgi:hypothetical protein
MSVDVRDNDSLDTTVWGGPAIRNPRQTYHLFEAGLLPSVKKLGGSLVSTRSGGDLRIVFDRRRHGPAYTLYILGCQISRKREEAVLL